MNTTNDTNQTPHDTAPTGDNQEQKVAYPDISKANTRTVIILSLICVVLIFFLSIFFPPKKENESSTTEITTEQTNSKTTSEEVTTTEGLLDMSIHDENPTSEASEVVCFPRLTPAAPGFQTIGGNTYYLVRYSTPYTGWLKLANETYHFDKDGIMATGWTQIGSRQYYFQNNGRLVTNRWVSARYVGEKGYMLTNTLTPDNIYVGNDGYANNSLGTNGSTEGLSRLKTTLEDMLSGYSGTWSIYVKDLNANEYLSINNIQYFSASLIKLYCAAAAYDQMAQGELEETESVDSLMSQMISISDNDAFNLMVMRCAPNNSHITGRGIIQAYIDKEGYTDTTITSILVPTKYRAPSSPGRNLTTVEDCGLLLEKVYKGKCVNPEYSEKFLDLLLNQTHINKIPAGLPAGTKCANKTGDTDEFQHDAAIVYSPATDYILCVMSVNCGAAIPNITKISSTVYTYFNP